MGSIASMWERIRRCETREKLAGERRPRTAAEHVVACAGVGPLPVQARADDSLSPAVHERHLAAAHRVHDADVREALAVGVAEEDQIARPGAPAQGAAGGGDAMDVRDAVLACP